MFYKQKLFNPIGICDHMCVSLCLNKNNKSLISLMMINTLNTTLFNYLFILILSRDILSFIAKIQLRDFILIFFQLNW